jgi:hypothetical protein
MTDGWHKHNQVTWSYRINGKILELLTVDAFMNCYYKRWDDKEFCANCGTETSNCECSELKIVTLAFGDKRTISMGTYVHQRDAINSANDLMNKYPMGYSPVIKDMTLKNGREIVVFT